jgi:DNA adenine methylase
MRFSVEGAPQPILRWAGSKKRSLSHLLQCAPLKFNKYIEPFAGSACLFFNLSPARAVLGDTNPHLMEFYDVAIRHGTRVYNAFSEIDRTADAYYEIRKRYQTETSALRRASYFLFLNRNCFNGIFRVNRQGNFNVPFSDSRVAPYPSKEAFLASIEKLRNAKLDCSDFFSVCERNVARGDFVYLDPPYYVPKHRVFREYVPHDFARQDIDRLRDLLDLIDKRGGHFLMNYPDCYMMRKIARQWNHHCIETRRTISGKLASRGNSSEILIYNFERRP